MLALKLLLTVAGALLLAAALAIPLFNSSIASAAPAKPTVEGPASLPSNSRNPLARSARTDPGRLPAAADRRQHRRCAQRHGRRPHQPDQRHASRHALPGLHFITPLIESVQIFDLRDHLFTAGIVEGGTKAAQKIRPECAVARRPQHRARRSPFAIASIPASSTACRPTCLSQQIKNSCRPLSPAHGAN